MSINPGIDRVTQDFEWLKLSKRATTIAVHFYLYLTVPDLLDFFTFGSSNARYARLILIFSVVLVQIGAQNEAKKIKSAISIAVVCITGLFCSAQVSYLLNAGSYPIYMLIGFIWLVTLNRFRFPPMFCLRLCFYAAQTLAFISFAIVMFKVPSPFPNGQSDGTNYFVPFNDLLGLVSRQAGIFSHANHLAPTCVLAVIGTLYSRKRLWLIPVWLITLMTTGSNTSYIACVVSVLLMASGNENWKKSLIRLCRRLAITALIALATAIASGVTSLTISNNTLTGRGFIWNQTLSRFTGKIFFGYGWGFESDFIARGYLPEYATSMHNTYLEWITNFGIAGMCFILPLFLIFSNHLSDETPTVRAVTGALLILGISESVINFGIFGLMTFLFIFICMKDSGLPTKHTESGIDTRNFDRLNDRESSP